MTTEGRDRFYRVATLIVDGGGLTLRKVLEHMAIRSGYKDVSELLLKNRWILQKLQPRVLKKSQMDLLFPPTGDPVDLLKLDATILTCVLINIIPLRQAQEAVLESFRNHRNLVYGHAASASLDDPQFRQYWSDISAVIVSISRWTGDVQFQKDVTNFIKDLEVQALSAGPVVDSITRWIEAERESLDNLRDETSELRKDTDELKNKTSAMKKESDTFKTETKAITQTLQDTSEAIRQESRRETNELKQMTKEIKDKIDCIQERTAETRNTFQETVKALREDTVKETAELKQEAGAIKKETKEVKDAALDLKEKLRQAEDTFKMETLEIKEDTAELRVEMKHETETLRLDTVEIKEELSQETSEIKHRLTGTDMKIQSFRTSTRKLLKRGSKMSRTITRLQRKQVDQDAAQRRIRQTRAVLQAHRQDFDKRGVNMRCLDKALEILAKRHAVTITGIPGTGKTFLSLTMLQEFTTENSNIQPMQVFSPAEIPDMIDPSALTIVLMDDIFGVHAVDEASLSEFCRVANVLKAGISNGTTYVITVMRKSIKQQLRYSMSAIDNVNNIATEIISPDILLDVDSANVCCTKEEKLNLLKRYAGVKEVLLSETDISEILLSKQPLGFPLLCNFITADHAVDLFNNPVRFILDQIRQLRRNNRTCFIALLLTVLCDDAFPKHVHSLDYNEMRQRVCGLFHCDESHVTLCEAADSLVHTFLLFEESKQQYRFVHESIFEAVVHSFLSEKPVEFLTFSPMRVISEYCYPPAQSQCRESVSSLVPTDKPVVNTGYYKVIVERFRDAVLSHDAKLNEYVAESKLWCHSEFLALFHETVCSSLEDLFLEESDDNQTLFEQFCRAGQLDVVDHVLEKMKSASIVDSERCQAVLTRGCAVACKFTRIDIADATSSLCLTIPDTCLLNAAEGGSVRLVEMLLKKGGSLKAMSDHDELMIHVACEEGHVELVKYLLEHDSGWLHYKCNELTPLQYAVCGGSTVVLDFLESQGADLLSTDVYDRTLLHLACLHNRFEMAKHLLSKYPSMAGSKDVKGQTVLMYAVVYGDIHLFDFLRREGCDINEPLNMGDSLLHVACNLQKMDMTKHLLAQCPELTNTVNDRGWTALMSAAGGGDVAILDFLIREGFDPKCTGKDGSSLLHVVCRYNNNRLEMAKHILKRFPEMADGADNDGWTALMYVAAIDDVDLLDCLIKQGCNTNCRSNKGESLLHTACRYNQVKMAKHLLNKCPDMISHVTTKGQTALMYTTISGNVELFDFLVSKGCRPDCRSDLGWTVLHSACYHNNLELTKHLLKYYPDLKTSVDNNGCTALMCAVAGADTNMIEVLLNAGVDPNISSYSGTTLLHCACSKGLEMTKYFLMKFPYMAHITDTNGDTALGYAVTAGDMNLVRYLVNIGLDWSIRTVDGSTLLHTACYHNKLEIARYLLQLDPGMANSVDSEGWTAIMFAASQGNIAVLDYLVSEGLDVRCQSCDGKTLLHIACRHGKLDVVKYLVNHYPELALAVDNNGMTAIMSAAAGGDIIILEYLVSIGFDIGCISNNGASLLHFACERNHLEMAGYLLMQYPQLATAVDNNGRTALMSATAHGHVTLADYLIRQGFDPN